MTGHDYMACLNPLKQGRFLDRFSKCSERGKNYFFYLFFFIWASATKRIAKSIIFRYWLPQDILSKRQKAREGGAYRAPPCFEGLRKPITTLMIKLSWSESERGWLMMRRGAMSPATWSCWPHGSGIN